MAFSVDPILYTLEFTGFLAGLQTIEYCSLPVQVADFSGKSENRPGRDVVVRHDHNGGIGGGGGWIDRTSKNE